MPVCVHLILACSVCRLGCFQRNRDVLLQQAMSCLLRGVPGGVWPAESHSREGSSCLPKICQQARAPAFLRRVCFISLGRAHAVRPFQTGQLFVWSPGRPSTAQPSQKPSLATHFGAALMNHNTTVPTGAASEGLPQPTEPVPRGCQDPFECTAQEFELSDKPKAARRKRAQNSDIDSDCYVDTGVSRAAEHSYAVLLGRPAGM